MGKSVGRELVTYWLLGGPLRMGEVEILVGHDRVRVAKLQDVVFFVSSSFVLRLGDSQASSSQLGPPVVPFHHFFGGEGSPTKMDYRKKWVPLF